MDRRVELEDWIERTYYHLWGCKHGHHRMKMSGCIYCGQGGSRQIKIYL